MNLDGEEITGTESQRDEHLGSFNRLEITTGSRKDLAKATLISLVDFHADLVKELEKAAAEYRMGDDDRSNKIFMRCIDGIQVLSRITATTGNVMEVDLRTLYVNGSSIQENIEKITSVLDELIDAQTQNDSILIADLIEYELQPVLEDWGQGLEILASENAAV